ncbi:MAG TPA: hypothetical protein DCP37_11555 [Dehalococcoidia bacterium]|nr:hypothetical protein [SAR202 cluster bacterium]MDP6664107.1 hypothetical protein [SAR202 cluster bacterium]MDP6800899.1 hypothetical protein [SAR202 cluster bacterium]HAL48378.1 hypothetical protein [Dehalococcoidia bacterium]
MFNIAFQGPELPVDPIEAVMIDTRAAHRHADVGQLITSSRDIDCRLAHSPTVPYTVPGMAQAADGA